MGELPKAFVVLRAGASAKPEELTAFCEARLAGYKVPRQVEFISEIPKNPVGKILKRVLKEREMQSR
jgi:long-chain acyl-CoA synthetase